MIEFSPSQPVAVLIGRQDYDLRQNNKARWDFLKRATGGLTDDRIVIQAEWLTRGRDWAAVEGWVPKRKPYATFPVESSGKVRKKFTHLKRHAAQMNASAHDRIAEIHQTTPDQFEFRMDWVQMTPDLVVHAISHDPTGQFSDSYIAIALDDDLRWEPVSYA